MYYAYTVGFVAVMIMAWWLTLFGLPGNWLIIAAAAAFKYLMAPELGDTLSTGTLVALIGLALLGELLEFIAGAAGMAKGGSKRGALLAIVGAMVGGIVGTAAIPIPIVGTIVMAAAGAMAGAVAGEIWKGRHAGVAIEIGKAAFWGRLFGTLAKVMVGAVMIVVASVAAFVR